ncbi:MGMT family protein [Mucilaginibacter sp. SG564]|uniref:MGMT family protein n=1 Tax=Mucilaginibacter sp. SG564 TaxID=2587022 RepID=UPI0015564877|nr:MGMT family protein [Mucilaginibacter sp. SG564]NOW96022.1 methylated-DNA-protein-cysteine methyltransferase-like protein [Mucilaginibacter sp. SG564]
MVYDNKEIYKAIFDVVRLIPPGRVTSYGALAKAVGLKSGARMVGRAMFLSDSETLPVPVHRVVNSSGYIVNDNGHRERELLLEGIKVRNDKIVDFKKVFWDPLKEIDI